MPRPTPHESIQKAIQSSDTRVRSTEGHPIIPTWMRESPKENVLPFNPVHTYLKNGREQDGHSVSSKDFDWSSPDD